MQAAKKVKEALHQQPPPSIIPEDVPPLPDLLMDNLPKLLGGIILVTLIVRYFTSNKVVPPTLTAGSFPWCLTVAGVVFTLDTIFR